MRIILAIFVAITLNGCIETAVLGTIATTGTVVSQERTVGQAVDDTGIFWHIKHLFLQKNAQDLISGVNVEVIEGRVHLTGNVDTAETRVDAVRLAWQPEGVVEVINEININKESTIKEIFQKRWIKAQLVSKLIAEDNVRSVNYSIEVVSGVVYLMGTARDANELDNVTKIASKIKGVTKVISHVRLKDDKG